MQTCQTLPQYFTRAIESILYNRATSVALDKHHSYVIDITAQPVGVGSSVVPRPSPTPRVSHWQLSVCLVVKSVCICPSAHLAVIYTHCAAIFLTYRLSSVLCTVIMVVAVATMVVSGVGGGVSLHCGQKQRMRHDGVGVSLEGERASSVG